MDSLVLESGRGQAGRMPLGIAAAGSAMVADLLPAGRTGHLAVGLPQALRLPRRLGAHNIHYVRNGPDQGSLKPTAALLPSAQR